MRIASGQVAVVTGAASGIGLALARELGRRGTAVVLADLQPSALDEATAALRADGVDVLAVPTDVADAAAVEALATTTLEHFGRVDIVCNNAGVNGPRLPSWEQDLAVWRWVLDVNLMGVVHGIHAFVPHLVARGSGHVLNTASLGGTIALPGLAPYSATKHAVVGITAALREELRERAPGVGATVLCPGFVETSLRRSSAGNMPERLEGARDTMHREGFTTHTGSSTVLAAEVVARLACDGIEADRAHVFPNTDTAPQVRARLDEIRADLA